MYAFPFCFVSDAPHTYSLIIFIGLHMYLQQLSTFLCTCSISTMYQLLLVLQFNKKVPSVTASKNVDCVRLVSFQCFNLSLILLQAANSRRIFTFECLPTSSFGPRNMVSTADARMLSTIPGMIMEWRHRCNYAKHLVWNKN